MHYSKPLSLLACLSAAACLTLAACASSSSTASAPSAAAATPAAVASPAAPAVAPMPTSSPTGELSCGNFDQEAAHLLTYIHYVSLNVGTINDTVPTFADMNEALGVMTAMAPQCAPKAAEAIAAMGAAAAETQAVYKPGDVEADKAANKASLLALKDKGVAAWTAMDKDPTAWDTTLAFTD